MALLPVITAKKFYIKRKKQWGEWERRARKGHRK